MSRHKLEKRPRRRASQTYFIKYQLARNPLKAEEDDLKQALLASLEQCGQQKPTSSKKQQQLLNDLLIQDQSSNHSTNSKTTKNNHRENHHQKQPKKQHPKHPSNYKQAHSKTSSLSIAQTIPVTPATVATSTPETYDEEYLEKYRPDTEDFLTFICFRVNGPKFPTQTTDQTSNGLTANHVSKLTNGYTNNNNLSSIIGSLNIKIESNNNVVSGNSSSRRGASSTTTSSTIDDAVCTNLRRSISPCKINSNSTSSTVSNQLNSPLSNRRRPPTRQSPRLANNTQQQQQKISDLKSDINSNSRAQQSQMNCNTALYQNPIINYEEDLKKASIALEDMAQEVLKSNGTETIISSVTTRQQNGKASRNNLLLRCGPCPTKASSTADEIERVSSQKHHAKNAQVSSSTAPLLGKNNKHLVSGLMTREFAGTFADEEIIFESISNHKL